MNFTQNKFYKPLMLVLCVVFLFGVSLAQRTLNKSRDALDLTRLAPLENAPPILAFTTVALGGFRGLIANALWIRANEMQENDQYFEMVQLADWITKLEPHFGQVWFFQAWNMAYNISVKFKDPEDRWRWVQRGISLLRDEGLKYNPDETLLYRELSWFFQHKMGHNLDDAHQHYKQQWFLEMNGLLGKKPNYNELLQPQTEEARARAKLLREKYKMDPQMMKEVDEKYGPLEWRLPDAHAVYWAEMGRRKGTEKDQNTVMRSIYQTMQASFRRGAIYENFDGSFTLGPNLNAIANVNKSYEDPMSSEDEDIRDQPKTGHKNFLRDAVYFLYMYNRRAEGEKWFKYLKEKYPTAINDYVKQARPNATITGEVTLEEYAMMRITEDVGETDRDRITAIIAAFIQNSFLDMIQDEDDRAANYALLAQQVWNRFDQESEGAKQRIGLDSLPEIKRRVLDTLLDPENGLPPEAAARLRTKLGIASPAPSATNAPASK
jgi:hypothetical protein